jgi:predicted Rossmann-fold nucleotide-binding protein
MMNIGAGRHWAIIGVVGKSNTEDEQLLKDARSVGEAIARQGHAVLTGGHHERPEASVKYYALKGARDVANEVEYVRLMGVLPSGTSHRLRPPVQNVTIKTHDAPHNLRYTYVHTQLTSEERDAITGQIADVLIALRGKSGTPREVAAALIAGRPVVFYNSLQALEEEIIRGLETARERGIRTARDFDLQPRTVDSVEEAVERALAAIGHGMSSQQPLEVESAEKAVEEALRAIEYGTPWQRLQGCYPNMGPNLKDEFNNALQNM